MTLSTPDVVQRFWDADQPTITTGDGLVLRPWLAGDASAVFAAFADPATQRWHDLHLHARITTD